MHLTIATLNAQPFIQNHDDQTLNARRQLCRAICILDNICQIYTANPYKRPLPKYQPYS